MTKRASISIPELDLDEAAAGRGLCALRHKDPAMCALLELRRVTNHSRGSLRATMRSTR